MIISSFFFWLLWIIDLLLCLLIVWGSGFRSGFGASVDLNSIMLIAGVIMLIGSMLLRYAFKLHTASLVVAALPLVGLLIWYIIDTNQH